MISVQAVSKTYGKKKQNQFTALKNVSLDIPPKSVVAIIGKSGSGKSTLMHVMSGLDRPTSGAVVINGQSLQAMKPKQTDNFRATQMSFIFQAFFVEANQTCYENVSLPLEIAGVPIRSRRQKIMNALMAVDLTDKAEIRASTLSGGQKQRLAIARAIVNEPRIIFADEPTGNLDSATGEQIIDLLMGLNRERGCTIVIVTHDPDLAGRCQYSIQMKDGQASPLMKRRSRRMVNS